MLYAHWKIQRCENKTLTVVQETTFAAEIVLLCVSLHPIMQDMAESAYLYLLFRHFLVFAICKQCATLRQTNRALSQSPCFAPCPIRQTVVEKDRERDWVGGV